MIAQANNVETFLRVTFCRVVFICFFLVFETRSGFSVRVKSLWLIEHHSMIVTSEGSYDMLQLICNKRLGISRLWDLRVVNAMDKHFLMLFDHVDIPGFVQSRSMPEWRLISASILQKTATVRWCNWFSSAWMRIVSLRVVCLLLKELKRLHVKWDMRGKNVRTSPWSAVNTLLKNTNEC
jgi:hypothetical protein